MEVHTTRVVGAKTPVRSPAIQIPAGTSVPPLAEVPLRLCLDVIGVEKGLKFIPVPRLSPPRVAADGP